MSTHLHIWSSGGADSPTSLTSWVNARLAAHQAALAELLAVTAPRTPANTLAPYDGRYEFFKVQGIYRTLS